MLKVITEENARELLFENNEYVHLCDGKMMMKTTIRKGEPPLCFVFPTALPIDGDGDAFVPGDAREELTRSYILYDWFGVDWQKASIFIMTGANPFCNQDELLRFELTPPEDATHVLIIVNWAMGAMPTNDMSCKLQVEFMRRFGATEDVTGVDILVAKKPACLASELAQAQYEVDANVIAGDLYAHTASQVAPIYLEYMKGLLPQLNSGTDVYDIEREYNMNDNSLPMVRLMCRRDSSEEWELMTRLPCDLRGAQRLQHFAIYGVI